ncbi:PREDICTED: uncharacterized protein LOC108555290 [Eufriesea mexicana]|uniref:uncharacterized protein LOC108555290 n=1 Tax=Eufriesea mexicana TaxID=516756 RepID=UPI00083BD60B|nr:PREDICTED: uncharacterized protein LOC108555290 [Eufriesea mexicana]
MRLPWIVLATVFILFLFLRATIADTKPSKREHKFVPYVFDFHDVSTVKEGSFITVPVMCPPGQVNIGNRCRIKF